MCDPLRILTNMLGSAETAQKALAALNDAGFTCVPKIPTTAMLDAAYWSALEENAAGVWGEMIAASDENRKI